MTPCPEGWFLSAVENMSYCGSCHAKPFEQGKDFFSFFLFSLVDKSHIFLQASSAATPQRSSHAPNIRSNCFGSRRHRRDKCCGSVPRDSIRAGDIIWLLVNNSDILFSEINKSLPANYLQWNREGCLSSRSLAFSLSVFVLRSVRCSSPERSTGSGRCLLYLHEPTLKFSQVRNKIIFIEASVRIWPLNLIQRSINVLVGGNGPNCY